VSPSDEPLRRDHAALRQRVAERVEADMGGAAPTARVLAEIAAAVRARTERTPAANLASHLRALEAAADLDVSAPVASSRAAGRTVKVAVHRLVGWYVGHLAGQVRTLGVATARAMRATVARVDAVEARVAALEQAGPVEAPGSEPEAP